LNPSGIGWGEREKWRRKRDSNGKPKTKKRRKIFIK
jgi:hypothetical protein